MDDTNSDVTKMIAGLAARHVMTGVAGSLVTLGLLQDSQSAMFVQMMSGLAVGGLGLLWSWWQKKGQQQVADLLKHVTNRGTTQAAVVTAEQLPAGSAVTPGLPVTPVKV